MSAFWLFFLGITLVVPALIIGGAILWTCIQDWRDARYFRRFWERRNGRWSVRLWK